MKSSDVTIEDLKKNHAIFIGGPEIQPLLKDLEAGLAVSYNRSGPNLSTYGFLSETVNTLSWIQTSPWSEQYNMLVFDSMRDNQQILDQQLLTFLANTDELATISVRTIDGQNFTNASYLVSQGNQNEQSATPHNEDISLSFWWIAGFIALFLIAALLLISIQKRRKNKGG